jgi:hypothetical protein
VAYWENRGAISATSVQGNVDTGDFRNFPSRERCIYPQQVLSGGGPHPTLFGPLLVAPDDSWQCNQRGLPGPFSINVQLYEDDECVKHPLSSSGPEFTFHIVIHRVEDGPRSPLPSADDRFRSGVQG